MYSRPIKCFWFLSRVCFPLAPCTTWIPLRPSFLPLMNRTSHYLVLSSMKVTKYLAPSLDDDCIGLHTSVWMISRSFVVLFDSFGNAGLAIFPWMQISQSSSSFRSVRFIPLIVSLSIASCNSWLDALAYRATFLGGLLKPDSRFRLYLYFRRLFRARNIVFFAFRDYFPLIVWIYDLRFLIVEHNLKTEVDDLCDWH